MLHRSRSPAHCAAPCLPPAAPLQRRRDEVEELCTAAVKEEVIEGKLKAVGEQWGQEIFTFADHKARGPVVLKAR